MPKTLLAVDDSATMRKVLEITFAGEDFRVVAADSSSSALARLGEEPVAAIIDASLGSDDGYALAKEIRARDGRMALLIMTSRYSPYDANRGREAGVDDYFDKPFDTQALIDKVKKVLVARETRVAVPAAAAPVAQPAAPATLGGIGRGAAPTAPAPVAPAKPAWPAQRTHTLSFEGTPNVPAGPPLSRTAQSPVMAPLPSQAAQPAPAASAAHPLPRPPAPAAPVAHVAPSAHTVPTAPPRSVDPAPAPAAPPSPEVQARPIVSAATNGHLAGKLGELGLSPQQVEAVLALSREVVEKVVWEVVPQLAETIIKEEIARLVKEG